MSELEAVRSYYASFGKREWERLERQHDGAVEFMVTMDAIARHVGVPSEVLDLGGGPGRYAIALAQLGHRVHLVDLSPELLAIAKDKIRAAGVGAHVPEVVQADARDLSRWANGSFDAVLSLGPYYHLTEPRDRATAVGELARVLRPTGTVLAAFMPRLALLRRTIAVPDERHHLDDPQWVARLLDDGVFDNDVPGRFTHAYGVKNVGEIEELFSSHGFTTVEVLAAESVALGVEQQVGDILAGGGTIASVVRRLLIDLARHRDVLGSAGHLVYVGRRQP